MGRSFNVYTDREFLPPGISHCELLKAHWGDPDRNPALEAFTKVGTEFLKLTAPGEAEVALLPFDARYLLGVDPALAPAARAMAERFAQVAAKAKLRTLMICNADSSEPVGIANAIVLRTSLERSRREPGDFALAAWFEDIVATHLKGSIVVRPKAETPVVGFCGLAASTAPGLPRRLKLAAKGLLRRVGVRIPHNDGTFLRKRAMDALQGHPGLETNFIVRDRYMGGLQPDDADKARFRREYVENLVESDYVLCVRGYGNFSFRFFEALSVGRIPVLIDTDCVLPYDFLHDYGQFCVIVPEAEIDRVGDHVLRFHARHSLDEFRELQAKIRRFSEEWLSPVGYFRNIPLHWDRAGLTSSGQRSGGE